MLLDSLCCLLVYIFLALTDTWTIVVRTVNIPFTGGKLPTIKQQKFPCTVVVLNFLTFNLLTALWHHPALCPLPSAADGRNTCMYNNSWKKSGELLSLNPKTIISQLIIPNDYIQLKLG